MTRCDRKEPRIHWAPAQERHQLSREEDSETTALIRRYLHLADTALEQRGNHDANSPADRMRRYFELADIWMNGKRKAS